MNANHILLLCTLAYQTGIFAGQERFRLAFLGVVIVHILGFWFYKGGI